ncbi:MAG: phosphate ABC transporter ATP-binding protein [Lachnospiraceae bacterium]
MPKALKSDVPALRGEGLCAYYSRRQVLYDLHFMIPEGQITAILGQSGCGKSTLLKSINRIILEDGGRLEGKLWLGEALASQLGDETLRKRVGLVFQTPVVFPCSVAQNILYASQYHHPVPKKEQRELVERYLQMTGLYNEVKGKLDEPASRLSGGQQQRLAIARSLCTEPEVLMLDEPCSALDMKNTILIEELLLKLKQRYTIVLVTHNIAQAKRIADHIIFMDEGKIEEQREAAAFFTDPVSEKAEQYIQYMQY